MPHPSPQKSDGSDWSCLRALLNLDLSHFMILVGRHKIGDPIWTSNMQNLKSKYSWSKNRPTFNGWVERVLYANEIIETLHRVDLTWPGSRLDGFRPVLNMVLRSAVMCEVAIHKYICKSYFKVYPPTDCLTVVWWCCYDTISEYVGPTFIDHVCLGQTQLICCFSDPPVYWSLKKSWGKSGKSIFFFLNRQFL